MMDEFGVAGTVAFRVASFAGVIVGFPFGIYLARGWRTGTLPMPAVVLAGLLFGLAAALGIALLS
jgi:hypothetical protein